MTDDADQHIVQRELDTDSEDPAVQIAQCVADIEGKETTDLTTMYSCVDHVLENLFSNPPDPGAQMQVEFSYETYRITVGQEGTAEFVKTE